MGNWLSHFLQSVKFKSIKMHFKRKPLRNLAENVGLDCISLHIQLTKFLLVKPTQWEDTKVGSIACHVLFPLPSPSLSLDDSLSIFFLLFHFAPFSLCFSLSTSSPLFMRLQHFSHSLTLYLLICIFNLSSPSSFFLCVVSFFSLTLSLPICQFIALSSSFFSSKLSLSLNMNPIWGHSNNT